MNSIKIKAFTSMVQQIKDIKRDESSIFMLMLVSTLYIEISGPHFTGPLSQSYKNLGEKMSEVFENSSIDIGFESDLMCQKYITVLDSMTSHALKVKKSKNYFFYF